MENFYKLYLKSNGSYQPPEIYQSKKKLDARLETLDAEYLLIHRHDDYDEIVSHKQAEVKIVDNLKSNINVKAKVFKVSKAKKKENLYNETKDYIDR